MPPSRLPAEPSNPREEPGIIRTVEETVQVLPLVRSIVRTREETLRDMERICWEQQVMEERLIQLKEPPQEHRAYKALREEARNLTSHLEAHAEELESLGGVFADPDLPTVHFRVSPEGHPVHLCWRPEDETIFVHEMEEDCTSRQPLTAAAPGDLH